MTISNVTLQVGQIIALVSAVAVGASKMTSVEAQAAQAQNDAASMRTELSDVRKELRDQREILAEVQGDARAILQIIKLQGK